MNRGGFSWKRFLGISATKARISRSIGIPLTKSGRQRKLGVLATKILLGAIIICSWFVYSLIINISHKIKNFLS